MLSPFFCLGNSLGNIYLMHFPEKSQQEIAEQVGCSQRYVGMIKEDNRSTSNIPPTRTDSIGRTRPTSYTKPEPMETDSTPEQIEPEEFRGLN